MNAVMISIKPKWCELIASGKKTIELRTTKPKLKTPFKCYIYETKGKQFNKTIDIPEDQGGGVIDVICRVGGKVIGEFLCDKIDEHTPTDDYYMYYVDDDTLNAACITATESWQYGKGATIYGWHISELKIYDKPKELSEFRVHDKTYNNCFAWAFDDITAPLKRPPQSWCYVETR